MKRKRVEKLSFFGDPNIGLFAKASDKVCLIGEEILEKDVNVVESILKVPIKRLTIGGTSLVGIFVAMNSNGILLPKIVEEEELKRIIELDMNFAVLEKTKYTALGNLILCNDKGALISPLLRKEAKVIADILDVEIVEGTVAKLPIAGSCGSANNNGVLLHRDATEEEITVIEDVLKVEADIGTVNFGSPFVASGLITNSKGVLIGDLSTGPEIARIVEALGFL